MSHSHLQKVRETTWAGCGQRVEQVMAPVPRADRCNGHTRKAGSGLIGLLLRRK